MRFLLLLALGLLGAPLMAETMKLVQGPDPSAWSLRQYRLPASELSVEGGRTPPLFPKFPSGEATQAEAERFLIASTERVNRYFKLLVGDSLPEGLLAAYDPASETLAVRAPGFFQDYIAGNEMAASRRIPANLVLTVHVLEAEASLLRNIMREASRSGDHRELWKRARGWVDQGIAREVSVLHLDTRSGQRAHASTGTPQKFVTGFGLTAPDLMKTVQAEREVGSTLEVDPVLGPDGATLDLSFGLQHDFASPVERWVRAMAMGPQRVDARLVDLRRLHLTAVTSVIDGGQGAARLLGVWAPETATDPEQAHHLQSAFLTVDVAPVQSAPNLRVLKLLEAYGEKLLPTPKPVPPPSPPASNTDGMEVRTLRVPMGFLSRPIPDDFFGPLPAQGLPPRICSPVLMFRAADIPFPEGSSATYSPAQGLMVVRNLPENLEKVQALFDAIRRDDTPVLLTFTVHVVQADGKLLRAFEARNGREPDQTPAFHALEDLAAQGTVQWVSSAWFETHSGQRSGLRTGTQYLTIALPKLQAEGAGAPVSDIGPKGQEKSPKPAVTPENEPRAAAPKWLAKCEGNTVGLEVEVDPVLANDGVTVDTSVTFIYHYAPPSPHENKVSADATNLQVDIPAMDFHMARISTTTTVKSGATRLLGIWKPEGRTDFQKGDVLQAAFLRMDVVRVGEATAAR